MTIDAKSLKIRSDEIVSISRNLDKDIHTHVVNILKFITSPEASGQVSPATYFLMKLHNKGLTGARVDAIRNWFETFGPLKWESKDGKEGFKVRAEKMKEFQANSAAMLKQANATPFFKLQKAKVEVGFDLDTAIAALVKRAEEKLGQKYTDKNGKEHEHKVSIEKLNALKAIAA